MAANSHIYTFAGYQLQATPACAWRFQGPYEAFLHRLHLEILEARFPPAHDDGTLSVSTEGRHGNTSPPVQDPLIFTPKEDLRRKGRWKKIPQKKHSLWS